MNNSQKKRAAGNPTAFFIAAFSALCLTVFLAGCSGSSPEILETRFRLVAFQDREKSLTYEYLSLAVHAVDEDGWDDLESLALIHDGDELYWQIYQDRWTKRQVRQDVWIAVEAVAAADYGPLPRGTYRIVVKDYAGSRAEGSLRLNIPAVLPEAFPSLAPDGENLVLTGPGDEAILMVKSAAGALLGSFILKKGPSTRESILSNVQIKNQAKHLYLYQQGPVDGYSLMSGPYEASDLLFPR